MKQLFVWNVFCLFCIFIGVFRLLFSKWWIIIIVVHVLVVKKISQNRKVFTFFNNLCQLTVRPWTLIFFIYMFYRLYFFFIGKTILTPLVFVENMTCNLDGFGFSKSLNAENMYCRIGSTVSTYKSQKSLLMFHK